MLSFLKERNPRRPLGHQAHSIVNISKSGSDSFGALLLYMRHSSMLKVHRMLNRNSCSPTVLILLPDEIMGPRYA
jgi:hypothetical protein